MSRRFRRGRRGVPAAIGLLLFLLAALARFGLRPDARAPGVPFTAAQSAEADGALLDRLRGRIGAGLEVRQGRASDVIDGDTLHLEDGARIRYLGIDTPEKGAPFYSDASRFNREMAAGRRITIISSSRNPRDGYGRLLGAVFIDRGDGPDGQPAEFVNAALIRRGLAHVYIKENDPLLQAIQESLLGAQNAAIDRGLGIFPGEIGVSAAAGPDVIATRHRYHRKDCAQLQEDTGKLSTREAALRAGKSPCRTCRP